MPLTYNNLWDQVVSFENIFKAYGAAARGRRFAPSALAYRQRLEEHLIDTMNRLIWKQWAPSRFKEFYVHDPKKRLISAPPFKDRVVHHALVQVIAPLFERKFIGDSYACRQGKGTHAAKARTEEFAAAAHRMWGDYYVLKGDVSAYFHSVDRQTLLRIIERTISDRDALWLIRQIVECDGDDKGIPIGALTSQLFANTYLDQMDHHVKDDLGVKMYVRYMDDFVVIHQDKRYLQDLLRDIEGFLSDRLKLTLNPKTAIYQSGSGSCHSIDFCGYRIWPGYTKPRKRTVARSRKRFRKLSALFKEGKIPLSRISASVMSFAGYMKHCSGSRTAEAVCGKLALNGRSPA